MTQRTSHSLLFISLVLVLGAIWAVPASAQNRILKGKVTNQQGEPVEGARVQIQGMDIKREYKTKTNKKGEYFYMGLPYGQYRVVIRAEGYQPDYAQGVRPSIDREQEIDFELKPGKKEVKLTFEMDEKEIEALKKKKEAADKQRQVSSAVQAKFDAGLALVAEGNHAGAAEAFQKAIELDPKQAYIHANLGQSLAELGRFEEALAAYDQAIALNPEDSSFHTNRGVVLGQMGRTEESQASFQQAAAIDPTGAAQNFFNLGATLVNSGKTADAVQAFKQAIAADANYSEAYYQLGICLSGNPATIPEAVAALEKYAEIGDKPDQIEVAKQLVEALKQ